MVKDFWKDNATQWNKVIEENSFPSRQITIPAILETIKKRSPRNILDVGCGEGFLYNPIVKLGITYDGMDGSAPLIKIAKEKWDEDRFYCLTYNDIISGNTKDLKKNYDCILFNFSLLDDATIEQLKAFKKLLIKDGIILIQTLHPCFIEKEYKDYWTEECFDFSKVKFNGTMKWFRRTLASWFDVFNQVNLSIINISEPQMATQTPSSLIFTLEFNKAT